MRLNDSLKKWILMTGYLVCVILLALIHEPWLDELHAWVMARDMSIPELWSAMKVEGHFCLWFWILMPFAKAGLGVYWLQIISIAFMLIAAWLLVFKTDFSLLAKVAILLSFPMVYQFPVISRCYALIPPILFGIALCYKDLDKNKWIFAILVGLLAHTHVYMEGMVLALFMVYIFEMILPKFRLKLLKPVDLGPLVVIVIFVLLAFVQVARNPSTPVYYYLGDSVIIPPGAKGIQPTASYIFKGYSVIPDGLFGSGMKELIAYTLAFIPMLALSIALFLRFSNTGCLIATISIGWQVLLSLFVFSFGNQRVYLPFFIILTILIMIRLSDKRINGLIIALCILASISGYLSHIRNDITTTYASFKPLAKAIEENVPVSEPIYSIDFGGDAILAYLTEPNRQFVPSPLDSIQNDTLYVISDRRWFDGFDVEYIYDGADCFRNRFSLLKLRKMNGER